MKSLSLVARLIVVLLPISFSTGCKSSGGAPTIIPRTQIVSPPATATVARSFTNAHLDKLAIIIEGSAATTPTSLPTGATWRGSLANGYWQSDAQVNAPGTTVTRFVEDAFIPTLLQKGYTVPSRSDLKSAMQELNLFNKTGLTESDASEVGKLLKASAIIVVSAVGSAETFTYKRESYTRMNVRIGARLVRVGQADILWLGNKTFSADVKKGSVDLDWLSNLFAELASVIPQHP